MLLKFAIKDFIEDREYQNLSDQTIEGYKVILEQFEEFCINEKVVNVEDVRSATIKSYIKWCRNRGNNPTSTNSKLRRLKAFFNYLVNEEIITKSPADKIQSAKENIKIETFTDYHIQQMLSYYRRIRRREDAFFAYRNHSIIICLLSTGLRRTELCHLKWSDIDLEDKTIAVLGKGGRFDTIPITDKLIKELASYKVYCEQFFGDRMNEYVFTNRYAKQLTGNAVQNIFKRLAKVMNFRDVRLSSHTFRHTFCQRCIQSGMSTFAIQKLMRHSNISITERYASMWGNDLAEQNDKYNPLNNLDI